jgi:GNAT superfamily N-acetyltransferase
VTARGPFAGASIAAELLAGGVPLPDGHVLWTLAERPDLDAAISVHNMAAWPAFMLQDAVADRLWDHLHGALSAFQLLLTGPDGSIAAAGNSAPLAWDGTDEGLPDGWDDQFERSIADHLAGRTVDTLGALQLVVAADRRGRGLSGLMVRAFRAHARLRGHRALIACVRPTWKERYPLAPIAAYAAWRRDDGSPVDPWIRVHTRLGARIATPSPRSMRIDGTVAEWERWTGMAFPETGEYVVPGAAATVSIDREADLGRYFDPNVWMVHDLAG